MASLETDRPLYRLCVARAELSFVQEHIGMISAAPSNNYRARESCRALLHEAKIEKKLSTLCARYKSARAASNRESNSQQRQFHARDVYLLQNIKGRFSNNSLNLDSSLNSILTTCLTHLNRV